MHSADGRGTRRNGAQRSITVWALRSGYGVLESCHCRDFRLRPIPLPLEHPKHPRWDYTYRRNNMYAEFPHETAPDNPQQ